MRWDVLRSGVLGVAAKTGAACDELATSGTVITAAASSAAGASGSDLVSGATTGFATAFKASVTAIVSLVDQCETAASTAVAAYGTGQQRMAETAASASGSVPGPDMPGRGKR